MSPGYRKGKRSKCKVVRNGEVHTRTESAFGSSPGTQTMGSGTMVVGRSVGPALLYCGTAEPHLRYWGQVLAVRVSLGAVDKPEEKN
jgi:hypothetical protein